MSRKLVGSLVFSLFAASTATAAPFVREEETQLRVISRGEEGYFPDAQLQVTGSSNGPDSMRLVWKAGTKTLATIKCSWEERIVGCEHRGKALTTTGAITAELIYWDDKAETDTVIRTFRTKVKKFGKNDWAIVADDVLGAAWMTHELSPVSSDFEFSATRSTWSTALDRQGFWARCTVDEKPLEDLPISGGDDADLDVRDEHDKTHHWRKMSLRFPVIWGSNDEGKKRRYTSPPVTFIDNPGSWMCKLRHEGKTVRELRFTVGADGMIENDEMQSGANPVRLAPGVVLIDSRLTKDSSSFDERLDPAA